MPHRPIILGVAGDSAAGKTTIATGIATILGTDQVTVICTDDYHRYDRGQRRALGISALHPDSNDIELLEEHLLNLALGQPILKPVYNHGTGAFGMPTMIEPRRFVIIEGLLGFATPALREHIHMRVFLDPVEELRQSWKLRRDTSQRGYTPDEVILQIRTGEQDSAEFIRPQRHWADLIVRFSPHPEASATDITNTRLVLRPRLPQVDLDDLVACGQGLRPVLRERVGRDDGRLTEIIEIDGLATISQADAVKEMIFKRVPHVLPVSIEQIGLFNNDAVRHQSISLCLTQLLIAYYLLLARAYKDQQNTSMTRKSS